MGHYDNCRDGYCGRCGQTLEDDGTCPMQSCKPGTAKRAFSKPPIKTIVKETLMNYAHKETLPKENNLADNINVVRLFQRIQNIENRLKTIEEGEHRSNLKTTKPKKELTQIGDYAPLIEKLLSDGKIWACAAMAEEIKLQHPELPEPRLLSLMNACTRMMKKGKLEKIGRAVYRKKAS